MAVQGPAECVHAAPASFLVLFALPEDTRVRVVARYGRDPATLLLDGFMMEEDRPVLAGRPFMMVSPVGRRGAGGLVRHRPSGDSATSRSLKSEARSVSSTRPFERSR